MTQLEYLFSQLAPLFYSGVFFLGLLIGSFLNVVILRLPRKLEHEWRCQCRELLEVEQITPEAPPGVVHGRSYCPNCGHLITALENIPVVSWLVLRGRCRECKNRISIRYPLVELATGVLFLVAFLHFGPTPQFLAALVLTTFLVALTGIDIDHQLLPDNLTLSLLWAGLVLSLFGVFVDPIDSIAGAAIGYTFFWSVFHIFKALTGKEGMGYGDFKLIAALGAWLGWQSLASIIVLSSVLGAIIGISYIALTKEKTSKPIPFGPFLAGAGWVTMLWGDKLLAWYMSASGF